MAYYKRNKQTPTKRKDDENGDFDDMGRKPADSAYHYANKRKLGRF